MYVMFPINLLYFFFINFLKVKSGLNTLKVLNLGHNCKYYMYWI